MQNVQTHLLRYFLLRRTIYSLSPKSFNFEFGLTIFRVVLLWVWSVRCRYLRCPELGWSSVAHWISTNLVCRLFTRRLKQPASQGMQTLSCHYQGHLQGHCQDIRVMFHVCFSIIVIFIGPAPEYCFFPPA